MSSGIGVNYTCTAYMVYAATRLNAGLSRKRPAFDPWIPGRRNGDYLIYMYPKYSDKQD